MHYPKENLPIHFDRLFTKWFGNGVPPPGQRDAYVITIGHSYLGFAIIFGVMILIIFVFCGEWIHKIYANKNKIVFNKTNNF